MTTYLIENTSSVNYEAEEFSIEINFPGTACYLVGPEFSRDTAKVLYFTLNGGDATENVYIPTLESNNKIQLDTFDIVNKRVSGKFSLTMIKHENWKGGKWYNPEELRFFNGEFNCNFVD
ncbi:MAG: hypothetical protein HOP11_13595 [Saprospiraceae bacterium]|nr:hypothetical protein [Saprospiraceae bacterium]